MEPDTLKIIINPIESFDREGNIVIVDDPRPSSCNSRKTKTMLELPVKHTTPTLRECWNELGNMIKRSLSSSSER